LRLLLLVAVEVIFFSLFFVVPALHWNLFPKHDVRTLHKETILHSAENRLPYLVFISPDERYLYVMFARSRIPSFGRIEIQRPSSYKFQGKFYENIMRYLTVTVIQRKNIALVHTFDRIPGIGRSSITHVVNLDTFEDTGRLETVVRDLTRSVYDPQTDQIIVIDKRECDLWLVPVDDFIAGNMDNARKYHFQDMLAMDDAVLNPKKNAAYIYGEGGYGIKEINLKSGKVRSLFMPKATWGLTLDEQRNQLYLSRPMDFGFYVVDSEKFVLKKKIRTRGIPRGICNLDGADAVAVGLYVGNKLLIYDTKKFGLLYAIPACAKIRSVVYDDKGRKLYFADNCGVHLVRIPRRK
ncbi:MAG: hypothetical protein AB1546_04895, partial [bacterium]